MPPRVSSLSRCTAVTLILACVARADGQLASKSPFMPPQAPGNAPTAGAPLEYRGYIETGDGVQYRIYDPARKLGTWVKLNERNSELDVVAKQYDTGQRTLTLEHQGKTLTLAEREAKVVSSGNAQQAVPPPMPAPPPANVAPAVTQSVVLNPTPADEQKRLEAVAAEVARRRALREQATQQMSQGQQPQVAVPQPPMQPQVQPPARPVPQQMRSNGSRGATPNGR